MYEKRVLSRERFGRAEKRSAKDNEQRLMSFVDVFLANYPIYTNILTSTPANKQLPPAISGVGRTFQFDESKPERRLPRVFPGMNGSISLYVREDSPYKVSVIY